MTFFIAAFVPLWDRTRYCCISWKRTAAFNPYLSRKALDKLGLSDRIKIIHGNHLTLPLETKSDFIMIAAQAEPKKDIFNYLAKVLPEVFEKYLRIPRLPPANNTVVFVTKEVC